ncbi:M20/M25/M40 family metallo-hydrolase [Candidatus Woesearchaeota archaeon]|nr:M20/M25/M40 family metallo-hydrolase [Candidatus Woesearchaeota archaeon]
MEPIELLKRLVDIKSDCTASNREVIDVISGLFAQYRREIIPQAKSNTGMYNLIIKIKAKCKNKKKSFVFVMHTDTVKGKWFRKSVESEGKIIGLGSCDMKAGIAAVCTAVLEQDYERDIYLVFNSDEETSGLGANLTSARLSVKDAIVIVPEPTSGKICIGQNSCVGYEIATKGRSFHSSLNKDAAFNMKNNAISKMSKIISFLNVNQKQNKSIDSQNIGFIEGGITANVIPDYCKMKFEQRFKPISNTKFEIANSIKELQRLGAVDIKLNFNGESFINNNKKLIDKFQKIVTKYYPATTGLFKAWSDAVIFRKSGSCFIFGPGNYEQAHQKGEYVKKSEVIMFKKIYQELLTKM